MSDAQREQLSAILDDIYEGFTEGIAQSRGKTAQEVGPIPSAVPSQPQSALVKGAVPLLSLALVQPGWYMRQRFLPVSLCCYQTWHVLACLESSVTCTGHHNYLRKIWRKIWRAMEGRRATCMRK